MPGITPEQIAQIYKIPTDRIAYPDGDMVKTLLDLREKQKGATAIVTDKPKQNYYVASLLDTQEPSQDDFRAAYKGSMTRAGADRDPLLNFHLARGNVDAYRKKAVLEQSCGPKRRWWSTTRPSPRQRPQRLSFWRLTSR